MSTKHPTLTESEKRSLRTTTDLRITSLCCYAALIIILIDLAAFIVGAQSSFFMVVGIMVAIALLASAGIQFCVIQKSLYTELAEAKRAADDKRVDEKCVDEKRTAGDGAAADAVEVDAKTK